MMTMVKVFFGDGTNAEKVVELIERDANAWLQANGQNAQVTLQTQMTYDDGVWLFTLSLVLVYP